MNIRTTARLALASLVAAGCRNAPSATPSPAIQDGDWVANGRTALGDRHSPLADIDRTNVATLAVAWRYHTG
jgi:quinoprotein glucose dehydrogenase